MLSSRRKRAAQTMPNARPKRRRRALIRPRQQSGQPRRRSRRLSRSRATLTRSSTRSAARLLRGYGRVSPETTWKQFSSNSAMTRHRPLHARHLCGPRPRRSSNRRTLRSRRVSEPTGCSTRSRQPSLSVTQQPRPRRRRRRSVMQQPKPRPRRSRSSRRRRQSHP